MKGINESLYYNSGLLLSRNAILNFVIASRGIGKSYEMKKVCIDDFLANGNQFIYLRRYKTELRKVGNYFKDIEHEYPNEKLVVEGNKFIINDKVAGWSVALSTAINEKSVSYPKVRTIVYEEFLLEDGGNITYIKNEPEMLLNFMDTVFRSRYGVRCVCLSNSVSIINPFFTYLQLNVNPNKRFNHFKERGVVVEIPPSAEFSRERAKTPMGRLIQGTNYGDFSLDNKFTKDNDIFIGKKSKEARFICTIVYKNDVFGIWDDVELGEVYVSTQHDPSTKYRYAMTTADHNPNMYLMTNWKKQRHLEYLGVAYKNGFIRFQNNRIKQTMIELFSKMRVF